MYHVTSFLYQFIEFMSFFRNINDAFTLLFVIPVDAGSDLNVSLMAYCCYCWSTVMESNSSLKFQCLWMNQGCEALLAFQECTEFVDPAATNI